MNKGEDAIVRTIANNRSIKRSQLFDQTFAQHLLPYLREQLVLVVISEEEAKRTTIIF